MCNYQMIFVTPFACSREEIDNTYKQIQQSINHASIEYRMEKEVEPFL